MLHRHTIHRGAPVVFSPGYGSQMCAAAVNLAMQSAPADPFESVAFQRISRQMGERARPTRSTALTWSRRSASSLKRQAPSRLLAARLSALSGRQVRAGSLR